MVFVNPINFKNFLGGGTALIKKQKGTKLNTWSFIYRTDFSDYFFSYSTYNRLNRIRQNHIRHIISLLRRLFF